MDTDTVTLVRTCHFCHKPNLVAVPSDVADALRANPTALIQNVWPNATVGQREEVISGTHVACWDDMFGDEV